MDIKNYMFNNKSFFFSLFISIAGGMIGTLLVVLYFINFNLSFLGPADLSQAGLKNFFPQHKLVIEQNVDYSRILNDTRYSIISIYKPKILIGESETENKLKIPGETFFPEDFAGGAIVLTSDGWIAFYEENFNAEKVSGYKIIFHNGTLYSPVKALRDNFTKITFIKIEANGLPVLPLEEDNLVEGQTVIIVGKDHRAKIDNVCDSAYTQLNKIEDYTQFSDNLSRFILLTRDFDKVYASAPLLNLKGAVAGIVNSSNTAISAKSIKRAFSSILKYDEIKRPALGIKYIDLTEILGELEYKKKGAFLIDVLPTFSGFEAGLKNGDIVLKVENEEVKNNNLPELIQEYERGTTIKVIILRGDKEIEKQVLLK